MSRAAISRCSSGCCRRTFPSCASRVSTCKRDRCPRMRECATRGSRPDRARLHTMTRPGSARPETFIAKVADSDRPFVGICFGHQLLARTLGAEVKRAAGGWGVGVLPMNILQKEGWMTPARSTVRLQYMHADQVTAPPDGATLLGEAPHCPVAMFQRGPRLLGIEAHPEFPAAYARALIERSARADR